MDDEDQRKHQFEESLPLPGQGQGKQPEPSENPEADIIRQRIEEAYRNEPAAAAEAEEVEELSPTTKLSKHQQFVNTLLNSGKSLAEIQTAWHEYYVSLPDDEKHEVWQEFYDMHAQTSHYAATGQVLPSAPTPAETTAPAEPLAPAILKPTAIRQNLRQLRRNAVKRRLKAPGYAKPRPFQSIAFGLAAGAGAIIIVLFSFFNERFIAPFIQPSRNVTNVPLISDATAIGPSPEIIIPKINVEVPVVYGVDTIDENAVDAALENGVVHYADSADPGQNGNLDIVGHSSNNIFNKGKYKFAFVLLSRLENGDTFYLTKDSKRYTYQVYQKSIVDPNDVSVLGTKDKPATATLITCDPPGTSLHRLVVVGQQIDPNPANNAPQTTQNSLATQAVQIPGNSESLWHRLTHWLSR